MERLALLGSVWERLSVVTVAPWFTVTVYYYHFQGARSLDGVTGAICPVAGK
jgi:hypothetical protein